MDDELDDEEPVLKYQSVGADLAHILDRDSATAITLHESFVCVGTKQGRVYLFDFNGHELRRFRSHTKQINDVCIDQSGEFICSGGEDGLVVINSLSSPESVLYNYYRPVYATHCDPLYAHKREKVFVAGGSSGQLVVNKRGWIIENENVIDEGEGPIECIRWKGSLIAWANHWGVKVYDIERQQRITFVEKPSECPPHEVARCCLFWESDSNLLIGWGDTIKILEVKKGVGSVNGTVQASTSSRYGELTAIYQLDFLITGVSAWNASTIAVLGYIPPGADEDDEGEEEGEGKPLEVPYPELHLLSRDSGDDIIADSLPVKGYAKLSALDYKLASTYSFQDIDEPPILYILSPKEVIVARKPSADDRIAWALSKENYLKALRIAQQSPFPLKRHKMINLVDCYLGDLIARDEYGQAANECPSLLGEDGVSWSRWLRVFAQKGQITVLAPFIPVEKPRLGKEEYELVLLYFLEKDPKSLLKCFKEWPKPKTAVTSDEHGKEIREEDALYDTTAWIARLEGSIKKQSRAAKTTDAHLADSLAELYCGVKDYEKALKIYLEKGAHSSDSAHVFELIRTHALWDAIQNRVLSLMQLDKDRASDMLARNMDRLPVNSVIDQLRGHPQLQHCYLMNLLEKCPEEYNRELYAEVHDLQASLCAEYAPEKMLKLLQVSNYANLEKALHICDSHSPPLYDAMIFILSRLGRSQQALDLLVTQVGDVHKAIEFVQEQDENLWDNLVQKSLRSAPFLSELLDYAGSHGVDPKKLVTNIPEGMEIQNLRAKLLRILVDYNQQVTLRQACSRVFASDCSTSLGHLLAQKRRAVRVDQEGLCGICGKSILGGIAHKKNASVAIFFCGHHYHEQCLRSLLEEVRSQQTRRRRASSGPLKMKLLENDLVCSCCHYSQYVPREQSEKTEAAGEEPEDIIFASA